MSNGDYDFLLASIDTPMILCNHYFAKEGSVGKIFKQDKYHTNPCILSRLQRALIHPLQGHLIRVCPSR